VATEHHRRRGFTLGGGFLFVASSDTKKQDKRKYKCGAAAPLSRGDWFLIRARLAI
jgi:hypothetical protein